MSARFGLRAAQQSFRQSAFGSQFNNQVRFSQKRFQSSAADAAQSAKSEGGFSKFWNSNVGPKTVHFWAPVMKLSLSQNAALMATGLIWTRWCFVIKPRNVFLASVNFLVFSVAAIQVTRVFLYQQSIKGDSLANEVKTSAKEGVAEVENVVKDPQSLKRAVEKS